MQSCKTFAILSNLSKLSALNLCYVTWLLEMTVYIPLPISTCTNSVPSITTWCLQPSEPWFETSMSKQNRQKPSSLATLLGMPYRQLILFSVSIKVHQGHLPVGTGTYGQFHIINWKCTRSTQKSSLVTTTHLYMLGIYYRRDDFAFRTQFSSQSDNDISTNPAHYYFSWNLLIVEFFKRHGALCPFKYSFILWVDVTVVLNILLCAGALLCIFLLR